MKKAARRPLQRWVLVALASSEAMEDQIREETKNLDGESGGEREPDGGHDRGSGEELLHGSRDQRGETVTLESASTMAPLTNSLKAARGQAAAAMVDFNARGRSIWISRMVASLLPRMAIR